jgi:hypothetical protein
LTSRSFLATDQAIADAAFARSPMAGRALLVEHLAAMGDAAASWRQVRAIAADIDIPAGNFRSRRGSPDAIRTLGAGRRNPSQRNSGQHDPTSFKHSHW